MGVYLCCVGGPHQHAFASVRTLAPQLRWLRFWLLTASDPSRAFLDVTHEAVYGPCTVTHVKSRVPPYPPMQLLTFVAHVRARARTQRQRCSD